MNIINAQKDLKTFNNNDLEILRQYYNIPIHFNKNDLSLLIAINIHSDKVQMAPNKVWEKYSDKLLPLLPSNLLENDQYKQVFLDADPDSLKKNLEWIVTSFISSGHNISELPLLKNLIKKFNKLREKKMITQNLVDFGGLNGFNRNGKIFPSLKDFLQEYADIKNPDIKYNVILNTDNIKVVQLLNNEASCKYGAHTKWCTTSENDNMFDYYNKQGKLYVIIPKHPSYKDEKYQFLLPNNHSINSISLMNEQDEPITHQDLISKYPELNDVQILGYKVNYESDRTVEWE
jgi:hypothetical protein